jgi:hypothetical protein
MGGFGSGRQYGRPIADDAKKLDFFWMQRKGYARPGAFTSGTLRWTCGGRPAGSISYKCDMVDQDAATLELNYTRTPYGEETESVRQVIRLEYTEPNFGGRRWWMICPYKHVRVGKLYLPPNGDRFASRHAWRLGYKSQRIRVSFTASVTASSEASGSAIRFVKRARDLPSASRVARPMICTISVKLAR